MEENWGWGGYKEKEKGRKCDGVCGEDEESIWENSGSIKKNIGEDEEIYRS